MIRDRGVALRYANALFGAAKKRGELEAVLSDLESIDLLESKDASFQKFLESPSVLDDDKASIVATMLRGRVQELVVQFVLLMLRKGRIGNLPIILGPYRKLVEAELGLVNAEVVSASPLTEQELEQMRQKLAVLTKKTVRVESKVDPRLIGGVIITIGDRIIDGSLRRKLNELREELLLTNVLSRVG